MTDTTDQQAVTVAQALAERLAKEADAALYEEVVNEYELGSPGTALKAIAAHRLASVSSASADYVLVPRKLTDDMHEAVVRLDFTSTHDPLWPEYWSAMIDAAPSPEPVPATNQAGEVERLRAALERIRDTADNLVPSVTIQGMRNIAGFALLGEVLP